MPEQTLYLTTYTYNSSENKFEYISLTGKQHDTEEENRIWHNLLPAIRASPILSSQAIQIHEGESALDLSIPQIILLFIQSKDLANPRFFDALAKGGGLKLRPYVKPSKRHKKNESTIYHPVITIGYPDITYLYSEEKESRGQHEWNKLIYECIELDKRFKVLDSSIWHRYVPVDPFDGTFSSVFEEVIADVIDYHRQGLYFTNASVISLEFQMRMLLHSYVARFGNKGHSEVVTPFKFHSERQMARKVKKEIDFLLEEWGHDRHNLLSTLKWRFLVVDDQANVQLSFIEEHYAELYPDLIKSNLIKKPLANLYHQYGLPVDGHIKIHVKELDPDWNIISDSAEKISNYTFDIIFLDYLLGYDSISKEREYGHEFLLELLKDNRLDYPVYKRDFSGKYWIFPISSYPHALTDKLIQLGINYLHEIWYIAHGADPVSVPHLYAYNLFRFIKQKVGKFFLYPNALKRLINQIPTDHNLDSTLWMDILREIIKNGRSRLNLLNREKVDANSSLFVRQMKRFVKEYGNSVLTPMFEDIEKLLEMLNEGTARRNEYEIREKIQELLDNYEEYSEALRPLQSRVNRILNFNHDKAIQIINDAIQNENNTLSLSGLNLKSLPDLLGKPEAGYFERIELNGNFLSSLPSFFINLKNLESLDLSNNAFEEFPSVLVKMNKLIELNFNGNKLELQPNKANSHKDIERMKEYADKASTRKQISLLNEGKSLINSGAVGMGIDKMKSKIPGSYENELAFYSAQYHKLMNEKDLGLVDDFVRQFEDIKSALIRLIDKIINELENP